MNTQSTTEQARNPINKNISKYALANRAFRQSWDAKRKHRTI